MATGLAERRLAEAQSQVDSASRRENATSRPSASSFRILHGTPCGSISTSLTPHPLRRRRPCGVPSGFRGTILIRRRRVNQFKGERGA